MKIYAHKPIPKTDVKIGKELYKCNGQGIIMLPEIYKQFNPIEEVKTKPVEEIKTKKKHKRLDNE